MARNAGKIRGEHNCQAPIREDQRDRIEVHVAGICVRPTADGAWEALAAKRTRERSLYPGKWECGGGHVRRGEDLQDAIKRQIFEEFGIDVEPYFVVETYAIPVPSKDRVIPGIRFLCLAGEGSVHVRLNKREFSSCRWVRLPVPNLDWIEGLKAALDSLEPALLSSLERKPPASAPYRATPLRSRAVN
jgi:8-oxo-dGTP pyrophosphatase MutT (NUDIX family)